MKFELNSPANPPTLLRKLVGLVVTVAVVALALMLSAVLLVVIVVVGVTVWAYLWWKTRELRKHMRDLAQQGMARQAEASNDDVFEGEVIRVVDPKDVK
jgi:O-antigen/teichoic acid export membrane protein